MLEALPGDLGAFGWHLGRPAPPRVSLQRVQEIFEPEGLDTALMQEVPDVEEDEAVDVGLVLEMPFEALQAVDEDERIAVGHQLSQGALGAGGARALERFGAPALPAVDPQIAGRALPQPALLHLLDQRRPQAVPGVVEEVRVWSCCPP